MKILITGGSGSGKSAFAEDTVLSLGEGKRIYLATMYPYDQESYKRIDRHRAMRSGKGFETRECYLDAGSLDLPENAIVLLECMSNLAANEMFMPEGAGDQTAEKITEDIQKLSQKVRHLVIVTNEIFSEAAIYEGDTRAYQQTLGTINRNLAAMCDACYEVVYGIPIPLKGGAA
ncbi:MAG: bifunctional adenosylcobinamide kinase/adenosylcobinamide-phosphate guanylyltransferase [Blautia sp.]|nr:bifunctional adenosylcobinamide kinase/adenosylcobinamide-phosphate guanylyltransferase [Blautia sp.]